jgi:hypothetical protein
LGEKALQEEQRSLALGMVGIATIIHPRAAREVILDTPGEGKPALRGEGELKATYALGEPTLVQAGEIKRHLIKWNL